MIYINPYLSLPINTIIGGVAGTISTKSALATKLGISESIITRFEIVGSDVHCNISSNYTLPNNCFDHDATITSYIDYDGKMYVPTIVRNFFQYSTIEYLYLASATILPSCSYCYNLTEIYAPNVVKLESGAVRNCTALTIMNVGLLTYIDGYAMNYIIATPDISPDVAFYGTNPIAYTKYVHLEFNMTSLPQSPFTNLSLCKSIKLPNLVTVTNNNSFFANWSSVELIEVMALKTFGSAVYSNANNTGFPGIKMGCLIKANIHMATANAGNPHQAFLYAKNTRGATVEFYDDAGNYVSTL